MNNTSLTCITIQVKTIIKKPFILAGRKAFPRYHPDLHQLNFSKIGGPEGARTPDLIHAMDALFQLRYRPMLSF
jgi:hypothetical protein